MRRVLTAAIFSAFALTTAGTRADEMKSCAALKWPLEVERAAFSDAGLSKVATGTTLGNLSQQTFELKLKPAAEAGFAVPPGGKPKTGAEAAFGGLVNFGAPSKAGLYQVTISSEGWIDLIQAGQALRAAAHTGAKECPGLRKSVRFALTGEPVILQISGSGSDTIKISVRPVE